VGKSRYLGASWFEPQMHMQWQDRMIDVADDLCVFQT
jgi:hypothetical protein